MKKNKIAIFEGSKIRREWDDKKEKWYFSVVDIISVLTKTDRPRKYWADLKRKLKSEGSEVSEKIGQLKLKYLKKTSQKLLFRIELLLEKEEALLVRPESN